jgi:TRAP-type mannitol/chloroaromatic compound transport system substrate-binding protein
MTARYDNNNATALRRLLAQGTQLRPFPRAVLEASWDASNKVYAEFAAKDPKFKAMLENYMGYRDTQVPWFRVAEASYDQFIGAAIARQK